MAKYNQSKSPNKRWNFGLLAGGATAALYSGIFSLYKWPHYLLCAALALLVGRVAQIMGSGLDTSQKAPSMEELPETGNQQVDSVVKRGQDILQKIRQENEQIPDPGLTRIIDEIESVSGKIFRTVIEQPGKAPQIRRFMDYYLPTTLKMLSSYRVMDQRKVQGREAQELRQKIESALEVVLGAFKKQLNTLYQDDILDISTDIDVLETMLKQDSLTGQPLQMQQGGQAQAMKEE